MSARDHDEVLVRVEGVSKKYCLNLKRSLWYGAQDVARELNPFRRRRQGAPVSASGGSAAPDPGRKGGAESVLRPGEFWAVRDVSFELRRRECLGLIGRNGAGKTTLLKLLSGLIKPDEGRITLRGKVGALIALGAGFNPILTGRENILINASVLGFARPEIQRKLDDIIAFSELGDFIDMPVQSYSSGMQVRLGFSVAVHLEPDILVVDEVLAVGDAGFKQKAYNAIYKIIQNAAVIFVSHSVTQIAKVCNSALLLHDGRVSLRSDRIHDVIDAYFREFPGGEMRVLGAEKARLREVRLSGNAKDAGWRTMFDGALRTEVGVRPLVRHGQPLLFEFVVEVDATVGEFEVGVTFSDMESRIVAQSSSSNGSTTFRNAGAVNVVRLLLPSALFNKGKYSLSLTLHETSTIGLARGEVMALWENVVDFQVSADAVLLGGAPIQFQGNWSVAGDPAHGSS